MLRDAEWRPTIVSVGHHGTLRRFHETIVDLGRGPLSRADRQEQGGAEQPKAC